MLTKIVIKLYGIILEVSLWLMLLVGFVTGWQAQGFIGSIVGVFLGAIFGAVFFGAFLVLQDIRVIVEKIHNKK